MDFGMTDEQASLVDWARNLARARLEDGALERAQNDTPEAWRRHSQFLADQGLLGLSIPEAYGGGGLDRFDALLVVEAISSVCPYSGAIVRWTIGGPSAFIGELGPEHIKQRYLPDIAAGKAAISIAMTEPEAGTATSDLRTRAVRVDGQFRINGSKIFITQADRATAFVVYCRFVVDDEDLGVGAIVVDRDTPGLSVGPPIEWIGGSVYPLYFDEVLVSEEQVLLSPSGGSVKRLMQTYNLERLGGLFELLGVAQLALDRSASYAAERHQFGKPIAMFQAIQLRLADMAIRLNGARLLTYRAASAAAAGSAKRIDVSMARVATSEMVQFVTSEAMHVHGGYGLTKEYGLEWLYRFTRHHTIAGGTTDIHRSMIAADLTGLSFDHRK